MSWRRCDHGGGARQGSHRIAACGGAGARTCAARRSAAWQAAGRRCPNHRRGGTRPADRDHELVATRVAQRTNDTVKTLTIVSVMLLPASLLSSILGMNFQLPLFDDAANFWWAVGAMATLMAGTLVVATVRDRG
jgi:hypothetical protein